MMIYLTTVPRQEQDSARLEELLHAIAQEDACALEELYRRTGPAVYGYALSLLKNTHDAQDVLQESFIAIHYSAKNYLAAGTPMAWIMTVAKNLCLKKQRERSKTAQIPEEDWVPYLQSKQELTPEDRLMIEHLMTLLSPEERQIVTLHALSGFRHREIAKFLDLPLATVLSKYHRAIKKLRNHL